MESITRPIYFEDPVPIADRCERVKSAQVVQEVDEYEEFFYKKAIVKMFEENKMIIVCQHLSMTAAEKHALFVSVMDKGMKIHYYNNKLMQRYATEFSQYQNMLPWFIAKNAYIVSPEPKVREVLKLAKKTPQLIVLGGLVENSLFSRDGLLAYEKLPSIELARGELVSILNLAAGGKTHSLLESHQQTLSCNLEQYIKQNSEGTSEAKAEGTSKDSSEES